jgi:hypothetical protein
VVQFVGFITSDNGVPCVGSALIANDPIKTWCQQVDEFAFGFVAPLQTNDTSSGQGIFFQ